MPLQKHIFLLFTVLLLFSGCESQNIVGSDSTKEENSYLGLTPQEFAKAVNEDPDLLLRNAALNEVNTFLINATLNEDFILPSNESFRVMWNSSDNEDVEQILLDHNYSNAQDLAKKMVEYRALHDKVEEKFKLAYSTYNADELELIYSLLTPPLTESIDLKDIDLSPNN